MPSLNFKANWKKNTTSAKLGEYGQAILGGVAYTLVPTLFRLSGPWGMVAGLASGTLIGILTDMPGMTAGTVGAWSAHAIYVWGQEAVHAVSGGEYVWRYNTSGIVPGTSPGGVYGLSAGSDERQMVQLDNGQMAYAYRSADLPSVQYPALTQGGMADYYQQGGMSDYYDQPRGMADRPALPGVRTTPDSVDMSLF